MPSGALEGSENRNKRDWEASGPESWSTLCFVPEEERLGFQIMLSKASNCIGFTEKRKFTFFLKLMK